MFYKNIQQQQHWRIQIFKCLLVIIAKFSWQTLILDCVLREWIARFTATSETKTAGGWIFLMKTRR